MVATRRARIDGRSRKQPKERPLNPVPEPEDELASPLSAGFHYEYAPEVADIATELIGKHHSGLANVHIEYIFRTKAATKAGKAVLGKAKKISGLSAFLADQDAEDTFFVMEIAKDMWVTLTSPQRKALVDHELTHFVTDWGDDGKTKLSLAPHDLEEFVSVVKRHGLWSADVVRFAKATSQMELPFETTRNADGTKTEEIAD